MCLSPIFLGKNCLPVTDDGTALGLVDGNIGAGGELVSDEGSGENTGTDTDSNDGVGRDIVEPDWLVLDVINNLTGRHASGSTAQGEEEKRKNTYL